MASVQAHADELTPTPAPTPVCLTSVTGIGPVTWKKVNKTATQLVVVKGEDRYWDENTFERWEKRNGCWVRLSAWWSLNGFNGWNERPWTGSLYSPIGIFGLSDTGGRLRNPGTTMPYHYGPKRWERGGYRISYPVQLYNYVVAINYNRRVGQPPRDERQPDPTTGSGYWIHQRGLGSTRGCVSLTRGQLAILLKWLKPSPRPRIVMGPTDWMAK